MAAAASANVRTISEREGFALPGLVGVLLVLAMLGGAVGLVVAGALVGGAPFVIAGIVLGLVALVSLAGFFILQPNQAEVLVLFGRYKGTVKRDGWYWTNPLMSQRKISLRVNNFNTAQLKVNDADGNPIEIAAVVVWRVVDTARAFFDVENYHQFVEVQSETALRHLASQYPYDQGSQAKQETLRGSADAVARQLRAELQSRLDLAGIHVVEARLSHLAYAPEIAGAMLQRQQAAAIIAARQRIATGAVGIVELVLGSLRQKRIVDLTPTQKAEMVTNLLVVLTSDRGAQPVLQTGSAP